MSSENYCKVFDYSDSQAKKHAAGKPNNYAGEVDSAKVNKMCDKGQCSIKTNSGIVPASKTPVVGEKVNDQKIHGGVKVGSKIVFH